MDDNSTLANIELERAVLGQIVGHGALAMYEASGLTGDAFWRQEHRQIYDGALAARRANTDPDFLTIRAQAPEVNAAYLAGIVDGVPRPTKDNASFMVESLQRLADARACYYAALKLHEQIQSNPERVDDAVAHHLGVLEQAAKRFGRQTDRYTAEGQFAAYRDSLARDSRRVFLGVPDLDEIIGGIRRGEVCGIMARPGVGKTLFLGHMIGLASNSQVQTMMFSLEMPVEQIASRLARSVYDVGRLELESGVGENRLPAATYHDAYDPLVVIDTPGLSVADIEARVRAAAQPQLVLIDHLGLVGGYRGLSTYDRTSAIARDVKEMAKRTGCAVVLAVQVSREAGGDGSRELTLGSARDSGIIEEVMDYLIAIRRPEREANITDRERFDRRNIMLMAVLKNRHGEVGLEAAVEMDPTSLRLEPSKYRAPDQSLENIGRTKQGGYRR
jgi:replicative DNA helicase